VDVADGIVFAADGKVLPPIQNLGKGFVPLKHLFDDFNSNINWEDDDGEEDETTGTVTFQSSVEGHNELSNGHSWADGEEVYRRQ
jgi:hypothetical protein